MTGITQTQDEIAGLKISLGHLKKYQKGMLESEAKEEATDELAPTSIFAVALLFVLVGVLFHYMIFLTN